MNSSITQSSARISSATLPAMGKLTAATVQRTTPSCGAGFVWLQALQAGVQHFRVHVLHPVGVIVFLRAAFGALTRFGLRRVAFFRVAGFRLAFFRVALFRAAIG